jgi:type I restriction enzyme S subunit
MENNWIECELGDVIELKRGYDLPKTNRLVGRVPVVSSSGESGFHNVSKVSAPGVVTGRYGTIGEVFFLEADFWPLNTTLYVRDFKGNDPLFIYYLLKTISYSDYTDKAAVPGINRNHIHKAKVKIPANVDYQHKIANYLSCLDKKIALSQQINQTLDQMAQTLYKSWFVNFDPVVDNALDAGFFDQHLELPDQLLRRAASRRMVRESYDFKPLPDDILQLFPDSFEECSEPSLGLGGWVPEGWDVKRLDGILELAYGKALKKTDRVNGNYPVYGSGGIDGTHVSSLVDGPGIIVGRKGTVGSIYWEPKNFHPIDTVFYVKPKLGFTLLYCYELLKTLGLEEMNTDAAVPGLNRNNAYRLLCVVPKSTILETFSQILSTYRDRIEQCEEENHTLTNLRDTLLPELISGEIRLSDIKTESTDEVFA